MFLPSKFEGGELVFHDTANGARCTYDNTFSEYNDDKISYVLYYSDMKHEIKPVLSGTRIVMTFDVCVREKDMNGISSKMMIASDSDLYPGKNNSCRSKKYSTFYNRVCNNRFEHSDIQGYIDNYAKQNKLKYVCIMLQHEYICDDLTQVLLKASDSALYNLFKEMYGTSNVNLVCLNTYMSCEFDCNDPPDVGCDPIHLQYEGDKIVNNSPYLNISRDECHVLLWSKMNHKIETNMMVEVERFGNHGCGTQHRYYHAGILIKMPQFEAK